MLSYSIEIEFIFHALIARKSCIIIIIIIQCNCDRKMVNWIFVLVLIFDSVSLQLKVIMHCIRKCKHRTIATINEHNIQCFAFNITNISVVLHNNVCAKKGDLRVCGERCGWKEMCVEQCIELRCLQSMINTQNTNTCRSTRIHYRYTRLKVMAKWNMAAIRVRIARRSLIFDVFFSSSLYLCRCRDAWAIYDGNHNRCIRPFHLLHIVREWERANQSSGRLDQLNNV